MKNLTASGKSIFWTLSDGSKNVCRVIRKKGGEDLVRLVEEGERDFEFEPSNKITHASYILFQQKRVVRMNRKAFDLFQQFLSENPLIKSKSKNDIHSTDSLHSISRNSESGKIPLQPRLSVSARSENNVQPNHPSIENYLLYGGQEIETRSENCQEERGSLVLGSGEVFSDELVKLEAFDRHLKSREAEGRQIVLRGEKLQEEGAILLKSDCESEQQLGRHKYNLGKTDIGVGNLTIGVAKVRREQCEIAIEQREIAEGQRNIAEGQREIREGQKDFAASLSGFARDIIYLNSLIRARGLDPEGLLDSRDADLERIAYSNILEPDQPSLEKQIYQLN